MAVGSDADLVLWDFDKDRQISVPSTSFQNYNVQATPIITICNGRIVWQNDKFFEEKTLKIKREEVFLPLAPNSPYIFSTVQLREKV